MESIQTSSKMLKKCIFYPNMHLSAIKLTREAVCLVHLAHVSVILTVMR